ncbi:MAG: phosphoribosyltransferase family protein, partial [Candidatus Geothermincolia bacterium]
VVIGFTTAAALEKEFLFAERVDGKMTLRRGFNIEPGARVLLVEDVITTGGSIIELARLVEDAGATVVALACIVQRGEIDAGGRRVVSLARISVDSYPPDDCPLCAEGVGIDSPGSRYSR